MSFLYYKERVSFIAYRIPHKVSVPEECPIARKCSVIVWTSAILAWKVLSDGNLSEEATSWLTARLNWSSSAHRRNAALTSTVSLRCWAIVAFRQCPRSDSVCPDKIRPARTPQRKSSPLGVRPMPSPINRASSVPVSVIFPSLYNSVQCFIRFFAAINIIEVSSVIRWLKIISNPPVDILARLFWMLLYNRRSVSLFFKACVKCKL